MERFTLEEFIKRAREVHGDKYDYSRVDYVNFRTKVEIFCPTHNKSFWQTPNQHIVYKRGCPDCGKEKAIEFNKARALTTEEFIRRAKEIHGDKYDYSKVNYTNYHAKVTIICKTCGLEYAQSCGSHLNGNGCPRCGNRYKPSTEEFIEKAKSVHGDYYDYSEVEYINEHTPVKIFCKDCQKYFWKKPSAHLYGKQGCIFCKETSGEREVRVWLENHFILFSKYQKFEGLKNINDLNVDFYLPDFNLAIEYQGGQHYKPVQFRGISKERAEQNFKETLARDKIKEEYFKNSDTNLLCIHYKDYKKIDEILEKVIIEKDYEYLKTTNSYIF